MGKFKKLKDMQFPTDSAEDVYYAYLLEGMERWENDHPKKITPKND